MEGSILEKLRKEAENTELLEQAESYAADYIKSINRREVAPSPEAIDNMRAFEMELPEDGTGSSDILSLLHRYGSPATMGQTGGRYFGFVNGGVIPVSLGAKWIADVWDQNAALYCISPIASKLEELCAKWVTGLLGLPQSSAVGFVSGSSMASLCGILAARNYLLKRMGYDLAKKGLFGAPPIRVVLGEEAHSTIFKALSILGFGRDMLEIIPSDGQGRIDYEKIPELDGNTLLLLQAGNVNSGAFDPFTKLCGKAKEAGAWVHIDGAFGLWAAASESFRELTLGMELADSWSCDAHKTLNAPYDNGIVICRNREALTDALQMEGAYIIYSDKRDGMLYTPDMSRRARGVELWAVFMSLGRSGVARLVESLHDKAEYFAASLKKKGFAILNEICFNQIVVSVGDGKSTEEFLAKLQSAGVLWCGGSRWKGRPVIRISVCSYRTTYEDIDRCVQCFAEIRGNRRGNEALY